MSESGASAKLGPDGERILPENDSAAELRLLLLGSEGDTCFQMMILRKILLEIKRCQTYVLYEFVTIATTMGR